MYTAHASSTWHRNFKLVKCYLCVYQKMFRKYCCAVIFQVLHIVFAKMYSFIAFGCIEVVLQMHAFLNKKEYRKER